MSLALTNTTKQKKAEERFINLYIKVTTGNRVAQAKKKCKK